MQPYQQHMPMGEAELVPEDPNEFARRVNELMKDGADEVKVFKMSNKQLHETLKRQGMSRKSRREWIKNQRAKQVAAESHGNA